MYHRLGGLGMTMPKTKTKRLSDYTDRHGFIAQKIDNPDGKWADGLEGGDSAQRTFTKDIAEYVRIKQIISVSLKKRKFREQALDITRRVQMIRRETQEGKRGSNNKKVQYVRHWDELNWPGDLWVGSRDNFVPVLMAMCLYRLYNVQLDAFCIEIMAEIKKRKGFLWNYKHIWPKFTDEPKIPDGIWPWNLASYRTRGFRLGWWRRMWLYLWDWDTVFNSIRLVRKSKKLPHKTSDDLNHQNRLVFKQLLYPTWVVKLAKWIYSKRYCSGPSVNERFGGYGPRTAFQYYYRNPNDPPMLEVWEEVYRHGLI